MHFTHFSQWNISLLSIWSAHFHFKGFWVVFFSIQILIEYSVVVSDLGLHYLSMSSDPVYDIRGPNYVPQKGCEAYTD